MGNGQRLQESGTNKDCNYKLTRSRLREIASPMLVQVGIFRWWVEIKKKKKNGENTYFFRENNELRERVARQATKSWKVYFENCLKNKALGPFTWK